MTIIVQLGWKTDWTDD